MTSKPVAVIAGLGSGTGTGAATAYVSSAPARLLANEGYAIVLIARGTDSLKALSDEITSAGGIATSFPIPSYKTADIDTAFTQIGTHYQGQAIRVALYNAGHPSLAKEFGKQNIHVSHAIIDGVILTNLSCQRRNDPEWEQNEDARLSPDGIAESYLYLIKQSRSNWTWELDCKSVGLRSQYFAAM
ncbi:hypothetical protein EV421DRAFT_1910985 [Armillaria borealis]|uniref:NAD(P)-binding protein n=1 Tax=Armillaria borealis TaxID=47425 RepID=A0AA39IZD8_9AGAR|nr:hypothetical protein EV421DRAFT_1910985 [Armillaria borealis]